MRANPNKKYYFRTRRDTGGILWESDIGRLRLAGHPEILMKQYITDAQENISEKSLDMAIKNLTNKLKRFKKADEEGKKEIAKEIALEEYENMLMILNNVGDTGLSPFVFYPSSR